MLVPFLVRLFCISSAYSTAIRKIPLESKERIGAHASGVALSNLARRAWAGRAGQDAPGSGKMALLRDLNAPKDATDHGLG